MLRMGIDAFGIISCPADLLSRIDGVGAPSERANSTDSIVHSDENMDTNTDVPANVRFQGDDTGTVSDLTNSSSPWASSRSSRGSPTTSSTTAGHTSNESISQNADPDADLVHSLGNLSVGTGRIDMAVVERDLEDYGDTDSNGDSDEFQDLLLGNSEAFKSRLEVLVKAEHDDVDQVAGDSDNLWILKKGIHNTSISVALPPDDWKTPEPKTEAGEPPFLELDNPGKWPSFVFRPKFDKSTTKEAALHKKTGQPLLDKKGNPKQKNVTK